MLHKPVCYKYAYIKNVLFITYIKNVLFIAYIKTVLLVTDLVLKVKQCYTKLYNERKSFKMSYNDMQ